MSNGYFRLVNTPGGFGLKIIPQTGGGEAVHMQDIAEYLHVRDLSYDPIALRDAAGSNTACVLPLGSGNCPIEEESFQLSISSDSMEATVRFLPPSETGSRITESRFMQELQAYKVVYGLQTEVIKKHFNGEGIYATTLVVARGLSPKSGKDAQIEYFFNVNNQARPTIREDGSVDFFDLNIVNQCKKGDILARLIPETPGQPGMTVNGNKIKAPDVKRLSFKYNAQVELSEDRLSLKSLVDGHVALEEGKVVVSNVLTLNNVDNSTGNIDFEGTVQINGNVQSNFKVLAKGNVIISGVVEGAIVEAGGDIIIARGMNGKNKGVLKAEGSIVSKFLESATAYAGKMVTSGAIMYSEVQAGEEIEVSGKKGMVSGGHISAGSKITVKNLGSDMGVTTILEVGADPRVKQRYHELQKEIAKALKDIRDIQPILENFVTKHSKGVIFPESQKRYMIQLAKNVQSQKIHIGSMNLELQELQEDIDRESRACVVITGMAHPGSKIVIGDASLSVETNYHYCRFEKIRGDVKMTPL
jgi:uncharacterized protein (DUF342 family)